MNLSKEVTDASFKKPVLVGKIGRLPKKFQQLKPPEKTFEVDQDAAVSEDAPPTQSDLAPLEEVTENGKTLPYKEPDWSGLPASLSDYVLEVLKDGSIIETINLMQQPFWIFGRLSNNDICMQHPTISRYHAVLQFRKVKSEAADTGYYIYDLESTHGTFLNKHKIRPRNYVRVHVGHMLKLGCSTRTYILNGPIEDAEEESALSLTELKQKRQDELRERELKKQEEEKLRKKEEDRGIDWGLGEDADDETDLSENPYATTNNEDLYLENPKKALRGFFEREGLDLEYDCSEQGIGQFVCKVELPLDDEMGRPIFAEVVHKGKKKEAVVQCALEACRLLDRHGVLRQATHESRKRKPKNWEENDYYDSDDDTFLDRTGSIEKKREMRMKAKAAPQAETYESLLEKEKNMSQSIKHLEIQLADAQRKISSSEGTPSSAADPLDSFMMELKQSKPNKQAVNKLKSDIIKLKQEHANIIKLVNIAKPATLPPLVANYTATNATTGAQKKALPIFGKRKKMKLQLPVKDSQPQVVDSDSENEEESGTENIAKEASDLKESTATSRLSGMVDENEQEVQDDALSQNEVNAETDEKRKRKNQRRIQQKQERAEIQKQKGYAEDANREDYSMWVPPKNQSGDGRTELNDKYGY